MTEALSCKPFDPTDSLNFRLIYFCSGEKLHFCLKESPMDGGGFDQAVGTCAGASPCSVFHKMSW